MILSGDHVTFLAGRIEEIYVSSRSSGKLVVSEKEQVVQLKLNIMYR